MALLDDLPHRCKISRRKFSRGPLGDRVEQTPEVISTNVPCWFQNASHQEIFQFQQRRMLVKRKIFFKTDPGVTERYRVTLTSTDRGDTEIAAADQIDLDVLSEALPDAGAGTGAVYVVMAGTTEEEAQ